MTSAIRLGDVTETNGTQAPKQQTDGNWRSRTGTRQICCHSTFNNNNNKNKNNIFLLCLEITLSFAKFEILQNIQTLALANNLKAKNADDLILDSIT